MSLIGVFSKSFIAEGIVVFVGFINSIIITRALGVEGRGQYSLAMTIITISALVLGDGLCRNNTFLTSKDKKLVSPLFGNLLLYFFFLAILMAAAGVWGLPIFHIAVPGLSNKLIWLSVAVVPFYITIRSMNSIFLGLQDYNRYNFFLALPFIFYLLINICIYFFATVTPELVLTGYNASMILVFVLILYLFIAKYKASKPDTALLKKSLNYSTKAAVSHISLFLLFRVDIILINLLIGVKGAGLYSISVMIAELMQKLANTSGNVIFPKLTGENTKQKQQLTMRVFAFVMIVSVVVAVFILLWGNEFIVLLFKKDFSDSALPLYWLLPGAVIMTGAKVIKFSLWAQGFPWITITAPVSALILNITLNLILIPRLGIVGAAIATSCSFIVYSIMIVGYYFTRFYRKALV